MEEGKIQELQMDVGCQKVLELGGMEQQVRDTQLRRVKRNIRRACETPGDLRDRGCVNGSSRSSNEYGLSIRTSSSSKEVGSG